MFGGACVILLFGQDHTEELVGLGHAIARVKLLRLARAFFGGVVILQIIVSRRVVEVGIGKIDRIEADARIDVRTNTEITGLEGRDRWESGLRLVPEGRELFPSRMVLENLRVAAFHGRRRRSEVRSEIDAALDLFPRLRERAQQMAGTLSGGEQQMLVAARALLFSPRVVLFDEISLGLAPVIVAELY